MVDIDELFEPVEDAMRWAQLVAFDGCHKIYLAMDETERDWFAANYEHTFTGSVEEMNKKVREWWDKSCFLRFVTAVKHTPEDPNAGFERLIDQGADVEPESEYEDELYYG